MTFSLFNKFFSFSYWQDIIYVFIMQTLPRWAHTFLSYSSKHLIFSDKPIIITIILISLFIAGMLILYRKKKLNQTKPVLSAQTIQTEPFIHELHQTQPLFIQPKRIIVLHSQESGSSIMGYMLLNKNRANHETLKNIPMGHFALEEINLLADDFIIMHSSSQDHPTLQDLKPQHQYIMHDFLSVIEHQALIQALLKAFTVR